MLSSAETCPGWLCLAAVPTWSPPQAAGMAGGKGSVCSFLAGLAGVGWPREQRCLVARAGMLCWQLAMGGGSVGTLGCGDQPFPEHFHQSILPPSAASRASLLSSHQAPLSLIPLPPCSSQGWKERSLHEGLRLSPLPRQIFVCKAAVEQGALPQFNKIALRVQSRVFLVMFWQTLTVTEMSDCTAGAQTGFDLQQALATPEELIHIIVSENGVFGNEIHGLMSPQPGWDPQPCHEALCTVEAMPGRCQKSAMTSP